MTKLSFCIPTYNRSSSCLNLVKEILSIENEDIEVIVSDNSSTDDTVYLLKQIKDKRLFVFESKQNNGSLFNIYNSFSKAKGQYIYFTTDKDFLNINNANKFLTFLSSNQSLSCGYCEYSPEVSSENSLHLKGWEAISKAGYIGRHPSGYFFHREKLESIDYKNNFSDKEFVGEFYLDFIFVELALLGDFGVFNKGFTIPQVSSDAAKDKSLSIKGLHTNAYYTPEARLKLAINQSVHLNELKLSLSEKKKMFFKVFIRGLISSTYGYKSILSNKDICEHYQLRPVNINPLKLLFIGCDFYIQYYKRTKSIRAQNHLNIFHFNLAILKIFYTKISIRFDNAK